MAFEKINSFTIELIEMHQKARDQYVETLKGDDYKSDENKLIRSRNDDKMLQCRRFLRIYIDTTLTIAKFKSQRAFAKSAHDAMLEQYSRPDKNHSLNQLIEKAQSK